MTRTYALILQNELSKRLAKNSNYSLRAFAKSLETSPSALSEILSGKRGISVKKGLLFASRIDLSNEEEEKFINSIKATKAKYKKKHTDDLVADYHQLTIDSLKVMSNWYHFAILNLTQTKSAKACSKWVASKLFISPLEAHLAIERLVRLELLEIEEGVMRRTKAQLKTPDDISSHHIQKLHRELLEKAITSMETVSVEKRDITSMVMAIDPKNMDKGKKLIRKFRKEITTLLEKGEQEDVYSLTVALIPLSKGTP
jgi:uncharacterized protein (TIGR02147 family)